MPDPYFTTTVELPGGAQVLVDRQTQAGPTRIRLTQDDGTDAQVMLEEPKREEVLKALTVAGE